MTQLHAFPRKQDRKRRKRRRRKEEEEEEERAFLLRKTGGDTFLSLVQAREGEIRPKCSFPFSLR